MSTIIRAADQQRGIQQPQFNFEDLASQAGRYLDKVRADAAAIIAAARQEAQAIRKQAESEGRAAGGQAVAQLVGQQLDQQLTTLWPALRASVQQIHESRQAWLAYWERNAVQLATAIARRIIRRELSGQPEITLQWVREALELAAGNAQVRVLLNPDDHRTLAPEVERYVAETASLGACEVVADALVAPGGCRIETRFGTIDQQIESQLARIEEELT